jgi:hypothetical protein
MKCYKTVFIVISYTRKKNKDYLRNNIQKKCQLPVLIKTKLKIDVEAQTDHSVEFRNDGDNKFCYEDSNKNILEGVCAFMSCENTIQSHLET